jgi:hypothetical protein
MRVYLKRKLAEVIDGVDLTSRKAGDAFEVSAWEARLLIAEEWAIQDRRSGPRIEDFAQRAFRRSSGTPSPKRSRSTAARRPTAAKACRIAFSHAKTEPE